MQIQLVMLKSQHSQFIQTVCWLFQSVPFNKVVVYLMVWDARVGSHASCSDLPHGDAKSPLQHTEY